MRIAQVAPLYESVPPRAYGGTERVVSYLTEELVKQGHEVTLFASGDSTTAAELIPCCPEALRLNGCVDPIALHLAMLERVAKEARRFDIIQFHVDYLHYPYSKRECYKHVTTLHGRLDIPELLPLYEEFPNIPVISISEAQRKPLRGLNWRGTIYHGLPRDELTLCEREGNYLAFIGRISPEKRLDRAIRIAKKVGMNLRVAAKVDDSDKEYFEREIEPMLHDPLIEFEGEVAGKAKDDFFRGARALLFPIDWPEPFGLVMIEAMACGTPVIAWGCGSVPEIITDNVNGFIVDNEEEAVKAVRNIHRLERGRCRRTFEARFTADRMAQDYVTLYQALIESGSAC